MSYTLIVRKLAEQDIDKGYQWYEERREGLGEEFLLCIDACLNMIVRNPFIYQIRSDSIRLGLVERFPYGIFYKIAQDKVIILAAIYLGRNPVIIKKRK